MIPVVPASAPTPPSTPGAAPARTPAPAPKGLGERTTWHLWANAPMIFWLLALVVVALAHRNIPASPWLLVHLLMLGAITNAILVWSQHFTDALLRRRITPGSRRWQAARLIVLNAGVAAVVAGMVATAWLVTFAGAIVVGAAVGAHGTALWWQSRKALAPRFAVCVRYYVAAAWLLPFGAGMGVVLAHGVPGGWQNRIILTHAGFNVLGFVGLTVVGTLVTLWPTMLRTQMSPRTLPAATRALWLLLGGLAVAITGVLVGVHLLAAAGVAIYLAGLLTVWVTLIEPARRRRPATFSTWSAGAAICWLTAAVAALMVILAVSQTWESVATRVGILTVPLTAGFAAQLLLGALTYLLPVVLGGGPAAVRMTTAGLERGALLRVILVNGGLIMFLAPGPSVVHVLASSVVLVAYVSFLPLLALAVRAGLRARGTGTTSRPANPPVVVPGKPGAPVEAVTGPRRSGYAVTAVAILALVAAGGVAIDPLALGSGGESSAGQVVATGATTTVQVETRDMRFYPSSIDVPAGNTLILEITNADTDVHDLALDTGHNSGRIAPGATVTLDVGVVGRAIDGWCTIVGHRQMGMVMTINAIGADAGSGATPGSGSGDGAGADTGTGTMPGMDHGAQAPSSGKTGAAADLDFKREPTPGFLARSAVLDKAPKATHHEVTMTVSETELEVAPGVRQKLWTFNGAVPGTTIRGKVGDTFDITLINDGTIGHSIDFHAGALAPDEPMRTIAPGEQLTYKFTATMSGIWMYHCGTMPMTAHIANGMFGAVVIDPPNLPDVDREYLIVQSEFYLGEQGGEVDFNKLAADTPDVVAFNGHANQYDFAQLPARVGERVRFWVLPVGPNRGTSFHIVGGQFDTVFSEGAYRLKPGNAEAGGSQALGLSVAQGGFVEMTFPEAGHYPMVSHVMIDAERGAHGFIKVTD